MDEDINFANERYVLYWAGKSESFKVLQAPTTKTLVPDKKESINFDETEHIFIDPVSENATTENWVYELLLKSGKDLNNTLRQTQDYIVVNHPGINIVLEKATQEIVDTVIKEKPQKVVALDRLFKGSDQLKTNTSLQMKNAEVEFKTI